MNHALAFLLLTSLGPLTAQEVELPDRPRPHAAQLEKVPARPAPAKPKARKAPASRPAAKPTSATLPATAAASVAAHPVPARSGAPGAAPRQLPPLADLGPSCLVKTRTFKDGVEVFWKGEYEPFRPPPAFLKQVLGSAGVPVEVVPYLQVFKLNRTDYFSEKKETRFSDFYLANGPGVLLCMATSGAKYQTSKGEPKVIAGKPGVVFTFEAGQLALFPATGPEQREPLAIAYAGASVFNFQRQGSAIVPYSPDGILAVAMTRDEAVGLFHYPFSHFTVPVKGVRWGDELWLESQQARPNTYMAHLETSNWNGRGISGPDNQRPVRIKFKLTEPRAIQVCFVAKGQGDWHFNMSGDLHDQSVLSLTAPAARIHDLPEVTRSFLQQYASEYWRVDDAPEGFIGQSDAAYVKAGLSVHAQPAQPDGKGRPTWDAWAQTLAALIRKAEAAGAKIEIKLVPSL